jgi:uncharacterized protein YbjT (DUF2867 family)
MYLIIGATGNIGKEIVKQLLAKGIRPRLGVRSIEKVQDQWGDSVDYIPFDFSKPETFQAAFRQIEKCFFIAPHHDPGPSVEAMLKVAAAQKVAHIVFSSGSSTADIEGKPLFLVEQLVRNSGLPWTILRPGWFMQNFTSWLGQTIREEDILYLPAADSKTAFIDVSDIAAVAVEVLTGTGHAAHLYTLTGPQTLDHFEVIQMLGEHQGKSLQYLPQSREDYIATMSERGWTKEAAAYVADLYDIVKTGKENQVSPDVENILGRKPRSFTQFLKDF